MRFPWPFVTWQEDDWHVFSRDLATGLIVVIVSYILLKRLKAAG